MPLNYDDPYNVDVRNRVQQKLQPTASAPTAGAQPLSPTYPTASPSGPIGSPGNPYPNDWPIQGTGVITPDPSDPLQHFNSTPSSPTWRNPPGYHGPDYSGTPGSYGGAPGQYNFSNPGGGNFPTWTPGQGWSGGPPPAAAAPDIETWGQGWVQSGGRTNQDFQNYLAAHPLPAGYSVTGNSGDRISGPNGYTRDAVIAAGLGGQGAQWLDTTQPQGGAGAGAAAMPTNPWIGQIRQMLLQRLQADQQPIDENAPQIAQPFQAAQLQASRGQDSERKALAEQLYAGSGGGGIDQNALSQGIQQSAERNAVGLGSLKASLIQQEYQSRRADLNDAMQQALASGDAELARQIQLVMANLDATVRREGIGASLAIDENSRNADVVKTAQKK